MTSTQSIDRTLQCMKLQAYFCWFPLMTFLTHLTNNNLLM
uniref:Uncharacterized protein n=1 Tax=Rhizophora mucronata TaxID=61149 RepID=A0A2P2QPR6_RHIMU